MDLLSQLLSLYPAHTTLDTRCSSRTAWTMEHAAKACGAAPYHLIVQGGAVLRISGHPPTQLIAGDMLVLPHGQAHAVHIGEGHPAGTSTEILCGQFHFHAVGTASLADSLPAVMLVRTEESREFPGLQALMQLLRDEADQAQPGAGAVVTHLASALLALILRVWLKQADTVPGLLALLVYQRLTPALQAMLKAPQQGWTVEQLARLCNMSRSTFLRTFRKVAGVTPVELLTRVRISRAALWLRQSQRGVGEVGAAVGYQSEAAFHRAFKRYTGKGPGQYRRDLALDPAADQAPI